MNIKLKIWLGIIIMFISIMGIGFVCENNLLQQVIQDIDQLPDSWYRTIHYFTADPVNWLKAEWYITAKRIFYGVVLILGLIVFLIVLWKVLNCYRWFRRFKIRIRRRFK